MKIPSSPGEFAFRALMRRYGSGNSWTLSADYYFDWPIFQDCETKWPVEELDNGGIYIPAPEELE